MGGERALFTILLFIDELTIVCDNEGIYCNVYLLEILDPELAI